MISRGSGTLSPSGLWLAVFNTRTGFELLDMRIMGQTGTLFHLFVSERFKVQASFCKDEGCVLGYDEAGLIHVWDRNSATLKQIIEPALGNCTSAVYI